MTLTEAYPDRVYTERKNALRAARAAAVQSGVKDPLAGVHFEVLLTSEGSHTFRLINTKTGQKEGDPEPAAEPAPPPPAEAAKAADATPPTRGRRRRVAAEPVAEPQKPAETAASAPPAPQPLGKRAQVLADAQAGKDPAKPTFPESWAKHYFRRTDEVETLFKAGDVAGLKALVIPTWDSGVQKVAKYRDLCVVALEARQAKG